MKWCAIHDDGRLYEFAARDDRRALNMACELFEETDQNKVAIEEIKEFMMFGKRGPNGREIEGKTLPTRKK